MDGLEVAIPANLENMTLPAPELITYFRNAENRVFWIDFDVDESLLEISRNILYINRLDKDIPVEERKPIKLFIFSYGGDLDACYNLLDICAISKTPIWTINAGVAMSAGMLIFLAGHKRLVFKRAQGLIHSGSGSVQGNYENVMENAAQYKKLVDIMREFILERTNINTKLFNKCKSKDWYLNADDFIKYGCADKIIDSIDEVL